MIAEPLVRVACAVCGAGTYEVICPPREVEAITVVVALGPYTGGGMHIAPGARMEDGLFDVVTIGAMSPQELLLNLPRIYAGTHLSHPGVRREQALVLADRAAAGQLTAEYTRGG